MRLRPILMTSIAFIAGVIPLVLASGAGAEVRHTLGVVVFGGMLGVTFFGLLLTPVFYVLIERLRNSSNKWLVAPPSEEEDSRKGMETAIQIKPVTHG